MPSDELIREGDHVMTVCNACRYCEGYCPVFPAMESLQVFKKPDLLYLANLCHNCGECLYACQYAPPHEFGINVPRTLAKLRLRSYEEYCWPSFLASAFKQRIVLTTIGLPATIIALLIGLDALFIGTEQLTSTTGDFYSVVPHGMMVASFGSVSLFVLLALAIGLSRFWRDANQKPAPTAPRSGWMRGVVDALTLRHLHNNGENCTDAEESRGGWRRRFHHATMYGFLLCFASTTVAAVYHTILGWPAPYGYLSLPVVLGTVGGLGLLGGPTGLLVLRYRRDRELADPAQQGLDVSFIVLLLCSSFTGLLLLTIRERTTMGIALLVHLGYVLTLFLTLPYGKFVHGLYRTAALIKYGIDQSADEHPVSAPIVLPVIPAVNRGAAPVAPTLSRRPDATSY